MTSFSLGTMPDIVIGEIMKKSNWKSVLTLRLVSQRLRDQVDHVGEAPFPKDLKIFIKFYYPESITIQFDGEKQADELKYTKTEENHCSRKFNDKNEAVFENQSMVDLAVNDLGLIFKFQKSMIESIDLSIGDHSTSTSFESKLKSLLESRPEKLKIQKLNVFARKTSQFMCILPYLDTKSLVDIDMRGPEDGCFLDLDEISSTEQWKQLLYVNLEGCFRGSMKVFAHFSRVSVEFLQFSACDLDFLKNVYIKVPKFHYFLAKGIRYLEFHHLSRQWGAPFMRHNKPYWYFRIPNSDQMFTVFHETHRLMYGGRDYIVHMSRNPLSHLPSGAVLLEESINFGNLRI